MISSTTNGESPCSSSSIRAEPISKRERETVEFSVKGPVNVHISDEELLGNSGCSLLEITFANQSTVGELTFRNYYTMSVTVLVKIKLASTDIAGPSHLPKEDTLDWILSVDRKIIMPNAHLETRSHDLVSISASESQVDWHNLIAMRLILRQPSPTWRTFHIEEITIFKDLPRRKEQTDTLLNVIRQQTIAALKWQPTSGQCQTGAYEFTNLPIP